MKKPHFYAIGFGVLMLFDVLTQVSFKLASSHVGAFVMGPEWVFAISRSPWLYGAVVGYIGAFIAWMTLLKHAPVGPAFAASHLGLIAVLVISVAYFGERLALMQVAGALCIVLGVVFLSLSEAKQAHG